MGGKWPYNCSFCEEMTRNKRYPVEAMTDNDSTDHLTLIENTPGQVESLLDILEQAPNGQNITVNKIK